MAIALALIPELFRGQKRHLANSLMLLAGRLGMGLVVAMCGWLIVAVDTWRGLLPDALQPLSNWRLTLLAAALRGLVLVPLILTMPLLRARRAAGPDEVPDALASSRRDASVAPAGTAVLPFLARHKLAFASFYFGVASMVLGIGAVMNFAPMVAMRQMSATPLQVANTMGAAMLVATVTGFLVAQVGYRQLLPRLGPRLPAMSLLAAAALGLMMAAGVLLARSPTQLFVCVGLFMTTVMAGTLLFPLALQEMAPAPLRGRLAAIAVTLNIVLGSLGPAVVGAVSDRLKEQPNGLLLAMVGVTCLAMLLSMLLLLPLQHRYVQAVSAARHAECVTDPRGAAA